MKYLPQNYSNVFVIGCGSFLPGEPVTNDMIDDYIAPLNTQSSRIKKRILTDNGIHTRYYAIHPNGETRFSAVQMGANAIRDSIERAGISQEDLTLLASSTSGGDVLMPGMGNMLQGELKAPPMEIRNHHGICAAGIAALKDAANHLENGGHECAVVCAVEMPSRLFKRSRFEPLGYNLDFDAHFLRWMLSDGAGACVLSATPDTKSDIALKLDWIHTKSFSGDYPLCMQLGKSDNESDMSFMDYPSFSHAEADGALALRQNTRLLPQLFEVAVHEYSELVHHKYVDPSDISHFLCHYSSERLGQAADELMQKAGLGIAKEKWFSNLAERGNTGSASIFIMLADLVKTRELVPGERIFCFVPESGRFTVSFMMFTVVSSTAANGEGRDDEYQAVPPPHLAHQTGDRQLGELLRQLASVWHDYRSRVWRTPIVTRMRDGSFTKHDYIRWMESWIPQVREGSKWMREAIANLPPQLSQLRTLIETHAGEEQSDFKILFEDYRAAGGKIERIDELRRNPGGEALNAFMHSVARGEAPVGLLGGIYIIEGTGQRIIPVLLPILRQQVDLPENCFRFLRYHGLNDMNHLARWLNAVTLVLKADPESDYARHIVQTARDVANLYLMQWERAL